MSNRISAILLMTLIALCGVIVIEARSGVSSTAHMRSPLDQGVDSAAASPVRMTLPPLAALSETVERPLFTETRRPPDEEPDGAPVSASPVPARSSMSFSVSAIVITDSERAVLLVHPQSGELTRLNEGETVAGWRLDKVESDRAVFSKDGESREAVLRTFGPPPPSRPQRALPTVRGINAPERKRRQPAGATRLRPFDPREEPDSER